MLNLTSSDPVVIVAVVLLILLIGGGAGGFVVAMRKDKRLGRIDEVALLEEVRKVARDEVKYMRDRLEEERGELEQERTRIGQQLRQERRERERVERYVTILRDALRDAGVDVPDWPTALRVVGEHDTGGA